MSAKTDTIVRNLLESIKNVGTEKTSAFDSIATVRRIEGNTAWVHFEGGAEETPARLTINAKIGDQVQVRVSNGVAFLVGNGTAPPTDDSAAIIAQNAANQAIDSANIAFRAASSAVEDAAIANEAATQAQNAASQAQTSANTANNAANSALTHLSTIEDVVGTLNWISQHGTYAASTDTEVVPGKYYFTRSGSGTEADPYVYTIVTNPTGNPSTNNYFELDSIDEAVSNYISTHLALLDDGLYVLSNSNGWKVRISNTEIDILDQNGDVIATYGVDVILKPPSSGQRFGQLRLTSRSLRLEYTDTQNPAVEFKMDDYIRSPSTTVAIPGTDISIGNSITVSVLQTYHDSGDDINIQRDFSAFLYYRAANSNDYTIPFLLAKGYTVTDENGVSVEVISQSLDSNNVLNHNIKITNNSNQSINYGRAGLIDSYSFNDESTQGKIGLDNSGTGDCVLVGEGNVTSGPYSGLIGYYLLGKNLAQFITGRFNKPSDKAFIIGNGYDDNNRSDAFSVDWDGNIEAGGKTITEIIKTTMDGVGDRKAENLSTAKSISTSALGTYTNLMTMSLEAGTWIVKGQVMFPAGGSNNTSRRVALGTSAANNVQYGNSSALGSSSDATIVQVVGTLSVTSATTVYMRVAQNSGSTLTIAANVNTNIQAVRII